MNYADFLLDEGLDQLLLKLQALYLFPPSFSFGLKGQTYYFEKQKIVVSLDSESPPDLVAAVVEQKRMARI